MPPVRLGMKAWGQASDLGATDVRRSAADQAARVFVAQDRRQHDRTATVTSMLNCLAMVRLISAMLPRASLFAAGRRRHVDHFLGSPAKAAAVDGAVGFHRIGDIARQHDVSFMVVTRMAGVGIAAFIQRGNR